MWNNGEPPNMVQEQQHSYYMCVCVCVLMLCLADGEADSPFMTVVWIFPRTTGVCCTEPQPSDINKYKDTQSGHSFHLLCTVSDDILKCLFLQCTLHPRMVEVKDCGFCLQVLFSALFLILSHLHILLK